MLSAAGIADGLDHKRRLHVGLDLLEFGQQLPVLGGRSQLPVDQVFGALGVDVLHLPEIVLFVEAGLDALEVAFFLQLLQFFFQLLDFLRRGLFLAFKIGALGKIEPGQKFGDFFVAQALVHLVEEAEIFFQAAGEF